MNTILDGSAVKKNTFHVTSLQLHVMEDEAQKGDETAPPPDPAPPVTTRPPVPSHIRPPIPVDDVDSPLGSIGWKRGRAARNGDCAPLSVLASCRSITMVEAGSPTSTSAHPVKLAREGAISVVTGTKKIGGVMTNVFRGNEALPRTTSAAKKLFSPWLEMGFWDGENGRASAAFLFGLAVHLSKQVAVLELSADKLHYLDPARVYAASGEDGALRLTPASPGKPSSSPLFFTMPISELIDQLTKNASTYCLIVYDGNDHFDPFISSDVDAALDAEVAAITGTASSNGHEPFFFDADMDTDMADVSILELDLPTKRKERSSTKVVKRSLAEKNIPSEDPPLSPKIQKTVSPVVVDVTTMNEQGEATLEKALSGKFSRFKPLLAVPEWLPSALDVGSITSKALHGELICFRWETYGWCVGRLGQTSDKASNFSALYLDGWRESQTLTVDAYSPSGEYGSWCLLESTLPASPIVDYKDGKYKTRSGDAESWHRFDSDALLHHSKDELQQARASVKEIAIEVRNRDIAKELSDGGFDIGDKVFVQGLAPSGETKFFEAIILGKRKQFPPLKVLYIKTVDGSLDPLQLPVPRSVHVPASCVQKDAPLSAPWNAQGGQ